MSEENAVDTVETTETVEELQARLRKAEARIVDMKKSTTPSENEEDTSVETPTPWFNEDLFEKKYAEKEFFKANPDMAEYKEQLSEYVSKGIDWEKAKKLVELDDPTIANRKVAQQTNFTSWDNPNTEIYTMEQLADIGKKNPSKYAKLIEDYKAGKIKVG